MPWGGRGSTRAWRAKRQRVLRRDQHRCQLEYPGCLGRATTVHHLVGWGTDPAALSTTEMAAACAHCNGASGDPRDTDPAPLPWL